MIFNHFDIYSLRLLVYASCSIIDSVPVVVKVVYTKTLYCFHFIELVSEEETQEEV